MTNEQITDLSAAVSLTVPSGATACYIQAESQNVRIRTDATAPTASVGILLVAGDAPLLVVGEHAMESLRAIEVAASAKLNVAYLAS